MRSELIYVIFAFLAGLLLGGFFFFGLWYTINRAVRSKKPAVWFLGSFFLRMAVALTGFYYVSGGSWQRCIACLAGFIAARGVIKYFTRHDRKDIALKKEVL